MGRLTLGDSGLYGQPGQPVLGLLIDCQQLKQPPEVLLQHVTAHRLVAAS
jgi:hypothetical protein